MIYKNIDINLNKKQILKLSFIQKELLEIMDQIHNICIKNKIDYSLFWGSMLGAVRHQGFIPWDDDMDIAMDANEYLKFKNIVNDKYQDQLTIVDYENKLWNRAIVKIFKKTEKININKDIFIDLFPISRAPLTEKQVSKNFNKMALYWNLSDKKFRVINNMVYKKNANKITKIIFKEETEYQNFYFPCDPYGAKKLKTKIFPKEWFHDLKLTKFENKNYFIFNKYQNILSTVFGNYKQLPPFNLRKGHHFF